MKKSLFILPLVLTSLVSFPGWGLTYQDLVEREGLWYKKFTDVHFNGKISAEDYQGNYKNGKKDGSWFRYREKGHLGEAMNWKNGVRHGSWVGYHFDGQLR